ncbi:hypothetical protein [Agaribacter marinus]|uniref:Uncharacterized protein n=1 Tax=Agaribacter marinus TaxID=1431249 RepID=A0AA37SXE4_9ALTE|nr:hypothetical protein [Agaribacter marinus]GLR69401.1 hypothetical protein GCM10007852_03090 [Agaribacter marinus]
MKAIFSLILLLLSNTAFSDDESGVSNNRLNKYFHTDLDYEAFFNELKAGLLSGDKEKVASLNLYPIRVNYPEKSVYYDTVEEFIDNYDKIIRTEMLSRVEKQEFSSLFYNYNGMHIGFGDIWFSGICVDGESCESLSINVWAYSVLSIEEK